MSGSGDSPAPESSNNKGANQNKESEDGSPPSPPPASSPSPSPPSPSPPNSPPPSPPAPSPPKNSPPPDESPTPPPKESPSPPPPSSPPPSPPPPSSPSSPLSPPPSPPPPPKSKAPPPPPPRSSPPKPSPPSPNTSSNSSPSPPKTTPPTSNDGNTAQPPPPSGNEGDQGNSQNLVSPPPPGTPATPAQPNPNPAVPAVPTPPKLPAPKTPVPPAIPPPPKQAPANQTADDASSPSNNAGHTGTVVGLTVAGVFLLALIAVVFLFVRRKKKKNQPYPPNYMAAPGLTPEGYYQAGPNSGQAESYYSNGPYPQSSFEQAYGSQRERNGGGSDSDLNAIGGNRVHFSYEEMMEITNGFSRQNVLGEGGFGCVYKGWMPDGKVVAVKQLKAGSGQGEREFRAEVDIISRVHHRHLVSLVGYCIAEQQRLLIYEYVPNKTLEHHLHGAGMPALDWTKRLKIALGSAKGLAYLHEDCHPKIIHRDIKSANILLDDSFEAQVADFGLAKLTDDLNTHVSTRVMGTFGYMAPEYASSGKLTDRSDVFSFGVVLLELVTGRKPVDATRPLGEESVVEWARPLLIKALESGDLSELVDPRLEKHYVEGQMTRMVEAAAACVRHSATKRPRMAQVCRALDCEGDDLSNGVKFGQSTAYDSGQYNEDIMRFRRMALGDSSEFGASSSEFTASKELSGPQTTWTTPRPDGSSDESETRAFNNKGSASRNLRNNSVRRY
ncbi:proline-rich receptor-like protein kinase PERK12 [Argentina anserina]|uniref:proline-rich receptor-like protein kinase PERK12 n=1 Tax=Argentina anserina TaxID=57926 RepID=UPI0021762709|nr:proline-rich receptor-like protein kinase PERK12 [Potentilla anserina]